ncbi:MAG: OsmC family protein [Candidatus Heimdallarchaeota archaeon]|nr:OsmC family protein [Candidatus Heimdallarchaeota archaeon]
MTDEHKYHVIIEMVEDRVGNFILEDKVKPLIQIATPPEFPGGKPGIHSPEDLFIGAVAACKMTTFCAMAEKLNVELKSLKIDATGYLGQAETRGMMFTKVDVHMEIGINDEEDIKNAAKCVDLTEKYCLISNSIKTLVNLTHSIKVVK